MELLNNQVVEFIENQRFICAVCIGKKGSRYHLLTHLGREVNLSRNRLIHDKGQIISGKNREELKEKLVSINERRTQLSNKPDLLELWELVVDEQSSWTPCELAELAFTGEEITPDHEAAIIRAVIDEHLHFKFREGRIHVLSRENVEQLLLQKKKEEERQRRLEKGIAWLESLWKKDSDQKSIVTPDEDISFWIDAIKSFCITGDSSEDSKIVKQLFKECGLKDSSAPFKSLVKAGVWSEDENLDLLRFGVERGFSKECIDQSLKIIEAAKVLDDKDRLDLTHLNTFTIDAPESQDLDDALSIEEKDGKWQIGIHITDVGLKIPPGTPLFEEAISRATTIYLPDEKIPMLPKELSEGVLSLFEGEKREAISFLVTVDEKGHIFKQEIFRSIIQVSKRFSYEEVDELIKTDEKFSRLYNLANALKKKRIEKGALPLPIPELLIRVDEDGEISVELCLPGPSRFLVSEFMILANACAANFLKDKDLAGLFRSQPEPRERIITGEDTDLLSNLRQRRLISRGHLGPEAEFHHGLGLNVYTTVTSPLRRALDLLMQQQIAHYLKEGKALYTTEDLEKHLMILEQGLQTASAIKQNRTRYWLLKYLSKRVETSLKALVIEVGQRRIQAVLKDYLITVDLPRLPGRDYQLGQEIDIKIKKVDPRENILKFQWLEEEMI